MLRAYEKTTTRMIVVLLLMLGLSSAYMFTVAGHIPVQSDFDPWKAAGLWHPIAMVTDIDQVPEIEEVRVQTDSKLIPVSDGDFKLNSYIKVAGDCRPYNRLLRRTEKPGVFTSQHGNQLRVMAVDYEDYIIVHAEIETHIAMYLSGRGRHVGDDIKQKFRELALSLNLPEEHIRYFRSIEQCTP